MLRTYHLRSAPLPAFEGLVAAAESCSSAEMRWVHGILLLLSKPRFGFAIPGDGMSVEVWGMIGAGIAALVAGLVLAAGRFRAASGAGRILVLGPVFEAVALTVFAAEHFLAARDLMAIV